jgi:hypothetical protein
VNLLELLRGGKGLNKNDQHRLYVSISISYQSVKFRELRAHVFLGPDPRKVKNLSPGPTRARSGPYPGPSGPRPGVFFHQYPTPCVYMDI